MLASNEFEYCCGVQVLYDFGWTSTSIGTRRRIEKKKIREFIRTEEKYLREDKGLAPSIMMVVLNGTQLRHLRPTFEKEGWEVIAKGMYHAAHRSRINILIKPLYGKNNESKTKRSIQAS